MPVLINKDGKEIVVSNEQLAKLAQRSDFGENFSLKQGQRVQVRVGGVTKFVKGEDLPDIVKTGGIGSVDFDPTLEISDKFKKEQKEIARRKALKSMGLDGAKGKAFSFTEGLGEELTAGVSRIAEARRLHPVFAAAEQVSLDLESQGLVNPEEARILRSLAIGGQESDKLAPGFKKAGELTGLVGSFLIPGGSVGKAGSAVAKGAAKVGQKLTGKAAREAAETVAERGAKWLANKSTKAAIAAAEHTGALAQIAKATPAGFAAHLGEGVSAAIAKKTAGLAAKGRAGRALARALEVGGGAAVEGGVFGIHQSIKHSAVSQDPLTVSSVLSNLGTNVIMGAGIGGGIGLAGGAIAGALSKIDNITTSLQHATGAADSAAGIVQGAISEAQHGLGIAGRTSKAIATKLKNAEEGIMQAIRSNQIPKANRLVKDAGLGFSENVIEAAALRYGLQAGEITNKTRHLINADLALRTLGKEGVLAKKIAEQAIRVESPLAQAMSKRILEAVESSGPKKGILGRAKDAASGFLGKHGRDMMAGYAALNGDMDVAILLASGGLGKKIKTGVSAMGKATRAVAGKAKQAARVVRAEQTTGLGGHLFKSMIPTNKFDDFKLRYEQNKSEILPDKLMNKAPKKVQAFVNRAAEIRALSQSPNTEAAIRNGLSAIAINHPDLVQRLIDRELTKINYLAQTLPSANVSPLSRSYPSDSEVDVWATRLAIANDPGKVIDLMQSGRLTQAAVETLKVVHPEVYQEIQLEIVDRIPELREEMDYQGRIQLAILFDVPVDQTFNSEFIAAMQQLHKQEAKTGGPSPRPRALNVKENETKAQRLTER